MKILMTILAFTAVSSTTFAAASNSTKLAKVIASALQMKSVKAAIANEGDAATLTGVTVSGSPDFAEVKLKFSTQINSLDANVCEVSLKVYSVPPSHRDATAVNGYMAGDFRKECKVKQTN